MNQISQSLFNDYQTRCKQFTKLRYIDKIQTKPSDAMALGLSFESMVLGAARGGDMSGIYPKTKKGEPTADTWKMFAMVEPARFALAKHFPNITGVQEHWETSDKIWKGSPDFLSDYINEDGEYFENVIGDLKLVTSKDVEQTQYSYFNWLDPRDNNLIQPLMYTWLGARPEINYNPSLFVYFVVSIYGWMDIVEVEVDKTRVEQFETGFLNAMREKLVTEKWQPQQNITIHDCAQCPFSDFGDGLGVCELQWRIPRVRRIYY